ncbi:PREDICTED: interleukin-17A-like [Cyprinodon variegatus]|uniref:interleukin-17A-like n=1 Tax=Cyprinodon variegatus TaxID=28743 RepID=UPI000742730E|nr:PREDICTED: interleukin-17A-like [Cyprinodon variegatus]
MKLQRRNINMLLVLCIALWVASSGEPAPPPLCNSTLVFSSVISSSSAGSGNIHLRSLSPWTWRTTTVKNRIPETIWEAECSSEFCLSPKPGPAGSHNLNSVPVYQSVLVLTRMKGSRCYAASYKSVAVGCTCVRASVDTN